MAPSISIYSILPFALMINNKSYITIAVTFYNNKNNHFQQKFFFMLPACNVITKLYSNHSQNKIFLAVIALRQLNDQQM